MTTAERTTAATAAPILRDAAYPLATFKALTALDTWALRQARRAGLKTRKVGRRRFVLGSDWLDFLATITDEPRSE